jgi:hypothetical protein
MISQSGAYSRLDRPAPYVGSGRKRFGFRVELGHELRRPREALEDVEGHVGTRPLGAEGLAEQGKDVEHPRVL